MRGDYSKKSTVAPSESPHAIFLTEKHGRLAVGVGEVVGAEGAFGTGWFANIYEELESIDKAVLDFDHQLFAQEPAPGTTDPKSNWYHNVWHPWFTGWRAFYTDCYSTKKKLLVMASPALARDEYFEAQKYRRTLGILWTQAQQIGFTIAGPAPEAANTPLGQQAADAGKSILDTLGDIGKFAKYALAGVIIVGGVVVVSTLAHDVKSDKDPSQRYEALANRFIRKVK